MNTLHQQHKGFTPVKRTEKRKNNDEWECVYDYAKRDYVPRQVGGV